MTGAPAPLVYIVIVNWNGVETTLRCLADVANLTYENRHVLVVDNASTDGSVARIRERYPGVDVVSSGGNLGYGGGNNLGMRHARQAGADYVWILNPDTSFSPDTLGRLVEHMQAEPAIGLLSPRVFHPEGGYDEALNHFAPYAPVPSAALRSAAQIHHPLEYIECAAGCSLLLRRAALDDLQGFDQRYFHFWEDVDLCWRAWDAGWQVAMARDCAVAHRAGSTTRGASALSMYYMLRNLLFFAAAAQRESVAKAMLRPPVARQWLACVLGVRTFLHPPIKQAIILALRDALSGRGGRCARYSPP